MTGKIIKGIAGFYYVHNGKDRIVYISCKPTSLVRDLVVLQDRGYRVEKVCGVDMFPGTGNVEVVIMMRNCGLEGK